MDIDDIKTVATKSSSKEEKHVEMDVVSDHLNGTDLLNVRLLNQQYLGEAGVYFRRNYDGATEENFFELKIFCENEAEDDHRYYPYIQAFGASMLAIRIHFVVSSHIPHDHWLYSRIRNHCSALEKVQISSGLELNLLAIFNEGTIQKLKFLHLDGVHLLNDSWARRRYPKLVSFITFGSGIEGTTLDTFFAENPQITELQLEGTSFELGILGQLKRLRSLHIESCEVTFRPTIGDLRMDSLDKCVLEMQSPWSTLTVIGTACKNLKKLEIIGGDEEEYSENLNIICNLKTLEQLRLNDAKLTNDQFKAITESLPKLTSLHLGEIENSVIRNIFPFCGNLEMLKFTDNSFERCNFKKDLFHAIAELTRNYESMKLTLNWEFLRADFTQGKVHIHYLDRRLNRLRFLDGIDSYAERSWLSEGDYCVEKIAELIGVNSQFSKLATCEHTRELVKKYFSEHMFHLTDDLDAGSLNNLAEYIHHMEVDDFGTKLNFEWPKIKTLKLSKCTMACLVSLKCPKVAHLEVDVIVEEDDVDVMNVSVDFGGAYRNLTALKVSFLFIILFAA